MRPLPRLYALAAYGLAPVYCGALAWRGFKERGYWHGFGERLGFGSAVGTGTGGSLWLHAASVGEVQAAAALVRALAGRLPDAPLVITTATPAGAARARALLGAVGRGEVRFLPLDLTGAVRRFLDRVGPRLALVMETELWPTLFLECRRRGVPVVLASARLSERSARRYRLLRRVFEPTLAGCALVGAQSGADAERFRRLGAPPGAVHVTGNVKFDFEVPAETAARGRTLREQYAYGRPLWVAGSTHEGEEEAALEAHELVRRTHPRALLVLAPRHPPRWPEVGARVGQRGLSLVRRSRGEGGSEPQVLLLDTLGELLDFYAAADVVFVGGSLVPIGGHNLLEPAALGRPILSGPHHGNAPEIARLLAERGALQIVRDGRELGGRVSGLLTDAASAAGMGAQARAVVEENRGALARLLAMIEPLLTR